MRETYEPSTSWERMVADYCGCTLFEVEDMWEIDYLALRRDAFVHRMQQTEGGREYLANAKRLTVTEMDADALREQFGSLRRE